MSEKSKLHWQCRRGIRELDILLERYLQRDYDGADAAEKAAFQQLLTLSEPQLAGYLLRDEPHIDPLSNDLIARILSRTGT